MRRFSTLALFACSLVPAPARSQSSPVLNSDVDTFINQILNQWGVAGGVSVAVVRNNGNNSWTTETKGYGAAKADGTPVNEQTLFAIGSNSKLFNIIATGLLIDNETLTPRISWTSKIADVIPTWGLEDPIAEKYTSIIDAMSHRTGMPRHDLSYKFSDDVPAVIEKLKHQRPSAEFREVWQYDNNMYTMLSYLPPLLLPNKQPFARYVKEHVLVPLGMNSTTYSFDVANATGNLADGMARQNYSTSTPLERGIPRPLPYWSTTGGEDGNVMSGAGGVISNAVDMATWLQALLLLGKNPKTGAAVIPDDVLQAISVGITVNSPQGIFPEFSPSTYGGGQTRSSYRGHEVVEHDGSVPGFNSQVSRFPNDGVGVAVLSNDDAVGSIITRLIELRIFDVAFGLDPVDFNGRILAELAGPPPPVTIRPANATLPTASLDSLVGVYTNAGYGTMELCMVVPPAKNESSNLTPACNALVATIPRILPGVVDPTSDTPLFLAAWNAVFVQYVRFLHFNENVFNLNAFSSVPTNNASQPPFWAFAIGGDAISSEVVAEFAIDQSGGSVTGFGMTGIWGAGNGVPSPQGNTVQERAEVFFSKVH